MSHCDWRHHGLAARCCGSMNRTNVLVVTWMLQFGRKIDNNGGAAAAKPMGRGASIVLFISAVEENNFCSSAVLSK